VRITFPISAAALAAALALTLSPAAMAQQNSPGWFMPNQGRSQQSRPAARPAQRAAPAPAPMPAPAAPEGEATNEPPPPPVPLPPVPSLPDLPKGKAPPTPVIGVLGVPDVMRASTAAQAVEKVIGERREKLAADAQKEQSAWRDMQQALANDRGKLSADQVRNRERELQERVTKAQKTFRDRNRVIQEAAQYGLAQIERTLIAVIRQVAESRGMNIVLHRQQVALNVNEFDITDQVTEQLNKVLPAVQVPPDGMPVAEFVKQVQAKEAQDKKDEKKSEAKPAAAPSGASSSQTAPAAKKH
jgi:Skp family chaperone for outer membrane proteins